MAQASNSNAVVIQNLSKNFGSKHALTDVSFTVPTGSIFGFLGPNGAGKTTTIRSMMDFIRPSSGTAEILGLNAHTNSTELKRMIGYLSSDSQLNLGWTGQQHIDFFESIKGRNSSRAALVRRLGLDTKTKVKALSSGNKQKLAIVLCLIGNPELLIMDEPTRGLDPLLQNELYNILQDFAASGKTVFLSSHNLGEVERICDTVLLIKNGSVVEEKTMESIRDMKMHMVSATSHSAFDIKKLQAIPNLQITKHNPTSVELKVTGDVNKVLHVLTQQQLTDISIEHASLEDIFLEQYKG